MGGIIEIWLWSCIVAGQNLTTQIKQLQEAGCESVFKEKVSGRKKEGIKQFNLHLDTVQKVTQLLLQS